MSINVCIFGVSGYTGSTLLKFLDKHKNVNLVGVFGNKTLGKKIRILFPKLSHLPNIKISDFKKFNFDKVDLIFTCLPHGKFQKEIFPKLKYSNAIIDLSGDFRIDNKKQYEKYYKCKHKSFSYKKKFVYGLTEINRKKIKLSKYVCNPGCYPTSILIPLIPLLKNNILKNTDFIIDSKSGVSGAGKVLKEQNLFSELNNNFFSYGLNDHKHYPEILQELNKYGFKSSFTFIPHLLPVFNGIQSNIYINSEKVRYEEVLTILKNYYKNETFVHVDYKGIPKLSDVQNTNNVKISVFTNKSKKTIIIMSLLDNLVKGAAGQAIQNMNLMFDFKEHESLL